MELNDLYEGIESPTLTELTAPADGDRVLVGDASATSGAKLKWSSLLTLYSWIKAKLDTAYALVYLKKDMSNAGSGLTPYPNAVANIGTTLSGAVACDSREGQMFDGIVTGDITVSITGGRVGFYHLEFSIGGTGSYNVVLASGLWTYSGSAPTLSATVGHTDRWTVYYNGSRAHVISVEQNIQTAP